METTDHEILKLLDSFPGIDLENMDKVKLMDRKDTKFAFNVTLLPTVLLPLSRDYHVLEVKGCSCCHYKSQYFDSPDYHFFFDHHRGKLNRYKVRYREYSESGDTYLEVKHKTNKDRTVKKRVKVISYNNVLRKEEYVFLTENLGMEENHLFPSLQVDFNRITLVNLSAPERVTLDTCLIFTNSFGSFALPGVVIAEAKQERTVKSAFVNHMKDLHIRRGSLSKYCLGISLLVPGIKHNNFNPKINHIKKMIHDTATNPQ